jgi:(1->4)-alpha-D-glucan 1-alpha-D-glucosylmutase
MRLNAPLRRDLDTGPAPSPADEVMLYEMLVAAWPLDLDPADAEGVQAFAERIAAWQEKAVREAKLVTEWAAPNEAYEAAVRDFLFQTLDAARPAKLADEIAGFALRLAPAAAINSLAQTLLRLTSPGVPDLYQGTDLWDFSLVDPDNRRPVDYALRRRLLERRAAPAEVLDAWQDGAVKQAVIARALAVRNAWPEVFAEGQYVRLSVEGPQAEHVLAFVRSHGDRHSLTVVTRLSATLLDDRRIPLVTAERWADTAVMLPPALSAAQWRDALGSAEVAARDGQVPVGALLADLPVGLFSAELAEG